MKRNITASLLSFLMLSLFSLHCTKGESDDSNNNNNNNNNNTEVGLSLPDAGITYVAYNVTEKTINNTTGKFQHIAVNPPSASFLGSVNVDTTLFTFSFEKKLNNSSSPWRFCNGSYDGQGTDKFSFYISWTGAPQKTLTQGKRYNISLYNKDGQRIPVAQTSGFVLYEHYSVSNTKQTSFLTYDDHIGESYLKIDKIENGKASGSFLFVPLCSGAGGAVVQNVVEGKFNNISIR